MKYLQQILSFILIITLFSCAKQSTPMGGPKDEDPPKLLSINPENESINTKPSTIELLFNEYVKVENANKHIIVTPRINKQEMEVIANRNRVLIKLNQDLEDSTTYVFNFQKTIKDITEGNAPENLRLVFSTGPDIDSLTFSGKVDYLFLQKEVLLKDVYVGLYEVNDTTDVLTAPPYYIGATDSLGNFRLTNIKEGKYLAYAWHDANNSLKAEEKQEAYSFIKDTILIDKNIDGAQFYLSKADVSEFKVNRSISVGSNFDIVLSKYPVEISIENEGLNETLFYRQNDKTLRLYHTQVLNDSIPVRLQLKDSVGFNLDTLLYAKFMESERKKEALETKLEGKKNFVDILQTNFKFNKPLQKINFDSLLIKYDTAGIIQVDKNFIYFSDSLDRTSLTFRWSIPDSISNESFTLYAGDSTFIDIESEFNQDKLESTFKRLKKETLSDEVKVKVNTSELPLIVQITDKRDEIIAERYLTESNVATFQYVEPGSYYIRAIVDRNKNKRWDTSNLREWRYAEPVYYVENQNAENSKDVTVRGGWVLELEINPRKEQGLIKDEKIEEEKPTEGKEIEKISVDK
ncbi:Ig-like domain-containing protein [Cecembia calidifontis]|uniref:Ig-like domain-containing protein n=2 Tax=Cecembia calidifontis TaxID=1187080 RepID=A0A4Q7P788_9BACT|nr:Ig-like domain-containing protein [Cecembia calidifontis]